MSRLGFAIPEDQWQGKGEAPSSLAAACEMAVDAEIENIALYDRLIPRIDDAVVRQVFQNLQDASRNNHLPAFRRCLAREKRVADAEQAGAGGPVAANGAWGRLGLAVRAMAESTDRGTLRELRIGAGPSLSAILGIPQGARGIVIFAHGSGSGRLSPRNNYVAARLREVGLATLLLDLLTPEEESDRRNVFDIGLLASRLRMAADWAVGQPETAGLRPCYFGASTGGGAALRAAAGDPRIAAVVSRGGRPDLAGADALAGVTAPTLLIVGELDITVVDLNAFAYDAMHCEREMVIVPGATHLFEEPGTLDQVVDHAQAWFLRHLEGRA